MCYLEQRRSSHLMCVQLLLEAFVRQGSSTLSSTSRYFKGEVNPSLFAENSGHSPAGCSCVPIISSCLNNCLDTKFKLETRELCGGQLSYVHDTPSRIHEPCKWRRSRRCAGRGRWCRGSLLRRHGSGNRPLAKKVSLASRLGDVPL